MLPTQSMDQRIPTLYLYTVSVSGSINCSQRLIHLPPQQLQELRGLLNFLLSCHVLFSNGGFKVGTQLPSKQNQTLQASPEDCFLFSKDGRPSVSSPTATTRSRVSPEILKHRTLLSRHPSSPCPWATRCYCCISGHPRACLGNNAGNPQGYSRVQSEDSSSPHFPGNVCLCTSLSHT